MEQNVATHGQHSGPSSDSDSRPQSGHSSTSDFAENGATGETRLTQILAGNHRLSRWRFLDQATDFVERELGDTDCRGIQPDDFARGPDHQRSARAQYQRW